jgi:hypothetical protein
MFLVGNNDIDIVIASLEIFKTKSVYTLTFIRHTRNRLHLNFETIQNVQARDIHYLQSD